jgi:hypothetical protein
VLPGKIPETATVDKSAYASDAIPPSMTYQRQVIGDDNNDGDREAGAVVQASGIEDEQPGRTTSTKPDPARRTTTFAISKNLAERLSRLPSQSANSAEPQQKPELTIDDLYNQIIVRHEQRQIPDDVAKKVKSTRLTRQAVQTESKTPAAPSSSEQSGHEQDPTNIGFGRIDDTNSPWSTPQNKSTSTRSRPPVFGQPGRFK